MFAFTKKKKLSPITFHRAHGVGLVHDDYIDVGELQSLQARLHALDDMFPR